MKEVPKKEIKRNLSEKEGPPKEKFNPETSILSQWMEIWRQTDLAYIRFLKRWELSLNEYFIMRWLYETPEGMEPAQLAEVTGVQRQLVSIILRGFEKRNLIFRENDKKDLRKTRIFLTGDGHRFAREVVEAVDELDLYGLSFFTPTEQELLLNYSTLFYFAIRSRMETVENELNND